MRKNMDSGSSLRFGRNADELFDKSIFQKLSEFLFDK